MKIEQRPLRECKYVVAATVMWLVPDRRIGRCQGRASLVLENQRVLLPFVNQFDLFILRIHGMGVYLK